MEWRTDMENAPKDGTPVFLSGWHTRFGRATIITARWDGDYWISEDDGYRPYLELAAWLPFDALPPPPVSP